MTNPVTPPAPPAVLYRKPADLALDELRDAAAAYFKAVDRHREAERQSEASDDYAAHRATFDRLSPVPTPAYPAVHEWDRWTDALSSTVDRARDRLVEAVLRACGRRVNHDTVSKLKEGWKPCAFRLDGRVYVVAPSKSDDATPTLVVVDVVHETPAPAPCSPHFDGWEGGVC
jgi:hypothetical protein